MLIIWVLKKIEYLVLIYNHNSQIFENVKLLPKNLPSLFRFFHKNQQISNNLGIIGN
jgi:hypothetical protein